MYLPFLRYLLALLTAVVVLLLLSVLKSPYPLLPLATVGLAYLLYGHGRPLCYMGVSREMLLAAASPEEVRLHRDFMEVRVGKRVYLHSFLRVRDVQYVDTPSSISRVSQSFINALHVPGLRATLIAVNGRGGLRYYVRLTGCYKAGRVEGVKRGYAAAVLTVQRQLMGMGVRAELADPRRALDDMRIRLVKVNVSWRVPPLLLASALTAMIATMVAPLSPLPALTLLVPVAALASLSINHLRAYRGGVARLDVAWRYAYGVELLESEVPGEAAIASRVSSMRLLYGIESPFLLMVELVPEDVAAVEAKVRRALEVLEAGRAGASRLSDELKAISIVQLGEALKRGALPFRYRIFLLADGQQPVQVLGTASHSIRPLQGSRLLGLYATLLAEDPPLSALQRLEDRVNPVYQPFRLGVTSQLARYSPASFIVPRTLGRGRALRLGHSVRRDEPVYLEVDALPNVHGLLVGPMGSGKSTTARTLALRAMEVGITPIFVDPSGEYRPFVEHLGGIVVDLQDTPLPLFEGPVDTLTLLREFQRAMSYVAPMSDSEAYLIGRLLERGFRDLSSLVAELERAGLGVAAKLRWLEPYFSSRRKLDLEGLLRRRRPVALCLGSSEGGAYRHMPLDVMQFAFHIFLTHITGLVLRRGLSDVRYLLVVDEGWLFSQPPPGFSEPLATSIARMYRKFGLALILVVHDWGDLDPAYRRHAGWRLAMASSSPEYLSVTRSLMELGEVELRWLSEGLRGRAVLRMAHRPHNFLLQVEPEEVARTDYWWRERPRLSRAYAAQGCSR
ncbi:MAG: hypothetical protein DRK00_10555 [Thermoprotei archaeon]|nr:MAG: hypothetical protein DRK00_10555 [Thermoprotei archaeon]